VVLAARVLLGTAWRRMYEYREWDPFLELEGIQDRLNRMFSFRSYRGVDRDELAFAEWAPAVDIQETDNEYVVKADLPEVKKEDVKVEFEDGILAA
jgi:HSP20 family protein